MSNLIHTIAFNKEAVCHNQYGVRFYNETTDKTAVEFVLVSEPPSKTFIYEVYWTIDPHPGDVIRWQYDGKGSYQDAKGSMMLQQDLVMINCTDSNYQVAQKAEVIIKATQCCSP